MSPYVYGVISVVDAFIAVQLLHTAHPTRRDSDFPHRCFHVLCPHCSSCFGDNHGHFVKSIKRWFTDVHKFLTIWEAITKSFSSLSKLANPFGALEPSTTYTVVSSIKCIFPLRLPEFLFNVVRKSPAECVVWPIDSSMMRFSLTPFSTT